MDQDGEVVDVFLQAKRDGAAAKRFFKRLLRSYGGEPRKIVTVHTVVARGHAVGGVGHVYRRVGAILFFSDATSIQVHGSVNESLPRLSNWRAFFFAWFSGQSWCRIIRGVCQVA